MNEKPLCSIVVSSDMPTDEIESLSSAIELTSAKVQKATSRAMGVDDIALLISIAVGIGNLTEYGVKVAKAINSRMKPLIIHFIGHGMREGDGTALVLEDEVGMARTFSEEELEIALSNHKKSPCQLALLNACHSEKLAQAFVTAGVDHVIAVNAEDKILDLAARCFSRRLYQGLFNQDAVADSFLVSMLHLKINGEKMI